MSNVTPFLWFPEKAEEAAAFYASIFPDSRIERVMSLPVDTPGGPAGSVVVVDLVLRGRTFRFMSAVPMASFNHAISIMVDCKDQAEIDRYWNALLDGGKAEACGWLRDRYGLSWQIVPATLLDMMADEDRERATRVTKAMLSMVKFDVAELKRAHAGE